MSKLDLSKQHKKYYTAGLEPEIVSVEAARYIAIDGSGDPSDEPFAVSISAPYAIAYAIKFSAKAAGNDFVVPKLEGLWWFDENKFQGLTMLTANQQVPRSEWQYRLLLRMPEFVDSIAVERAKATTISSKGTIGATDVLLADIPAQRCVQMLHVGPFATEIDTLNRMLEFMDAHKLKRNGHHHEIYLSDFRRTAPEKLRTILREPVEYF